MTSISGVFERRRSGSVADPFAPAWRDPVTGLAVAADARLDNRNDLPSTPGSPDPATPPDSSLILGAWEKWGSDCPRHLIGDFAFAIWDPRRRMLFCARDHVGVRP